MRLIAALENAQSCFKFYIDFIVLCGGKYTVFLMQIVYLPQFFMGAKNCKFGELIRQNVTEQHHFDPERCEIGKNLQ